MKKELKVLLFLIISLIAFTPNIVLANIRCNDGTYSPTCTYNHSGCCSHHGGVASSYGSSTTNNKTESSIYSDDDYELDGNDVSEWIIVVGGVAVFILYIKIFEELIKKIIKSIKN